MADNIRNADGLTDDSDGTQQPVPNITSLPPTINEQIRALEAERIALQERRHLRELTCEVEAIRAEEANTTPRDTEERAALWEGSSNIAPGAPTPRSVAGSLRSHGDEALVASGLRKSPRPKDLPVYHGKNIREHQKWVRAATTAFRLGPEWFPTEYRKIV